jgi:hypothetical protein
VVVGYRHHLPTTGSWLRHALGRLCRRAAQGTAGGCGAALRPWPKPPILPPSTPRRISCSWWMSWSGCHTRRAHLTPTVIYGPYDGYRAYMDHGHGHGHPTPDPMYLHPTGPILFIGGHTGHMGQGRPDLRRGAPVLKAEAPPAKVGPEWRRAGSTSARGGLGRLFGAPS